MQVVVTSVVTLFILVFIGFFIGKRGTIHKDSIPDFSTLVISVTMPVTVFCTIAEQDSLELAGDIWKVLLITFICQIGSMFLGMLVIKIMHIPDSESGVWIFNFMFSNNGFMGFPMALAIFGSTGLFLMAMANVVLNLLIFSIGLKFMTWHYPVKEKISLKKMLVNNINIAVVIGFIFFFAQIPLPDVVTDLLDYISEITAGLSMLVVGLSLSRMDVKDVFKNKKIFVLAAFRLLVIPFLVITVFRIFPIHVSEEVYQVILLSAALPSASAQTMLAEQYHTNTSDASRAVFITTLFSVVTIPVVMAAGL